MADKESPRRLTDKDWRDIADFIRQEFQRRKLRRKHREAMWSEIDRQISMAPVIREKSDGTRQDWYPDLELPWQANALEVTSADVRSLMFPRGTEWFTASSDLSDDYISRFDKRRETNPIVGRVGADPQGDPVPIKLDKQVADTLVKAVIDHYHRLYSFRDNIDLWIVEQIKYGTGVGRLRPTKLAKFSGEFRGKDLMGVTGPAFIPTSIWKTYLDDSPNITPHEGISNAPSVIRIGRQRLESLRKAARTGGPERGWIMAQIKKLGFRSDEEGREGFVDLAEFEGDLIVPQSRDSIVLPNVIVTIALNGDPPRPVRFQLNPVPFRSYVTGTYFREDPRTPYGASPLMKGMPIQDAATEMFNDLAAAAALNVLPPVGYDGNDPNFTVTGGPEIYPGAKWATDSPNAIEPQQIGDITALTNGFLSLQKQYEDLTGVNDPRRGSPVKSHTTRGAVELEASRGIARTDDFATQIEQGPMTSILHMEYEIIKDVLRTPQSIPVNAGGISGWVTMAAQDLPDLVSFMVEGSAGLLNNQQRNEQFVAAANFAIQMLQLSFQARAAGIEVPFNADLQELATEIFQRAGIPDPGRFLPVAESPQQVGLAPGGPGVPGANGGTVPGATQGLVPQPTGQ